LQVCKCLGKKLLVATAIVANNNFSYKWLVANDKFFTSVCNVISFLFMCELKKLEMNFEENHLWVRKYAISFIFLLCVSRKNHLQLHKCTIFFFFTNMNKKITCGLASVQYHFFSSFVWIKKTYEFRSVQYWLFLHLFEY